MMIKSFVAFALLVWIAESVPLQYREQQDQLRLDQLLREAKLQQEKSEPLVFANQEAGEDDEGVSVAEIKMLKGILEAQQDNPIFMQQQDDSDYALMQLRRFRNRLRNFTRRHRNELFRVIG